MNKVRFHYAYPINIDIDTEKEVDVYIDQIDIKPALNGNINIVILEEPKKNEIFNFVLMHKELYDHVLTFHESLLLASSKAKLFLPMTVWVKNYISKKKEFSVSTVVGGKRDPAMLGYQLRHNIWLRRRAITIPRKFYLSGNATYKHIFKPWKEVPYIGELILGASKEPLFDSMFHIAIENTSIKNYFSEKLLDCFQSRTIPIYYGCTNIDEFFNIEGIFVVHNLDEIIKICNKLIPDIYYSKLNIMEENYQKSLKWCVDYQEQIKNKIIELI